MGSYKPAMTYQQPAVSKAVNSYELAHQGTAP